MELVEANKVLAVEGIYWKFDTGENVCTAIKKLKIRKKQVWTRLNYGVFGLSSQSLRFAIYFS